MQQPGVPLIDGVCLPAGRRSHPLAALALVLIVIVLLVEQGADPTVAVGGLAAAVLAAGRIRRG